MLASETSLSDTPWLDNDAEPLVRIRGVTKRFGEVTAIDNVDLENNHRTPNQLWDIVRTALELSDEYVWIYSQKVNWWNPESAPAHQAALQSVREIRMKRVRPE